MTESAASWHPHPHRAGGLPRRQADDRRRRTRPLPGRPRRQLGERQRGRRRGADRDGRARLLHVVRQAAAGRERRVPARTSRKSATARCSNTRSGTSSSPACRAASRTNSSDTGPASGTRQLSQRYVDESVAEYVEPDIIADDPELHALWLDAVRQVHAAYVKLAEKLNAKLADPKAAAAAMLPPDADRTTRRKAARQAARSVLPERHRDEDLRHRQRPRAAALPGAARQRLRRAGDPQARRQAPRRPPEGRARTSSATTTKVPLPDGTFELTTPFKKV